MVFYPSARLFQISRYAGDKCKINVDTLRRSVTYSLGFIRTCDRIKLNYQIYSAVSLAEIPLPLRLSAEKLCAKLFTELKGVLWMRRHVWP